MKYWVSDTDREVLHEINSGYGWPDGWTLRVLNRDWWLVDTDGTRLDLERLIAAVAATTRPSDV